jgi:hypothetical protein
MSEVGCGAKSHVLVLPTFTFDGVGGSVPLDGLELHQNYVTRIPQKWLEIWARSRVSGGGRKILLLVQRNGLIPYQIANTVVFVASDNSNLVIETGVIETGVAFDAVNAQIKLPAALCAEREAQSGDL